MLGPLASRRHWAWALVLCTAQPLIASASSVPVKTVELEIHAVSLAAALRQFASQAQVSLLYPGDALPPPSSIELEGRYRIDAAMSRLLEGTDLEFTYDGSDSIAIYVPQRQASTEIAVGSLPSTSDSRPVRPLRSPMAIPSLLEEIVVSAARATTDPDGSSMSVVALDTMDLRLRGLERAQDLSRFVPNLAVVGGDTAGETAGSFYIRGVPNVTTYIDGVWISGSEGLLMNPLVDVDRVDVMRGPQGTTFGKSSTGGAVRYVTTPPATELGVRMNATFGALGRHDSAVAVDVPLARNLFSKVMAATLNQSGYIESLSTDRSFGDVGFDVLKAELAWLPSPDVRLLTIAERAVSEANGMARVLSDIEPSAGAPLNAAGAYNVAGLRYGNSSHVSGDYETHSDFEGRGYTQDSRRYSVDLDWDVTGVLKLEAIAAVLETDYGVYSDLDGSEYRMIEQDLASHRKQLSQELRLRGATGRLDWVTGVYLADVELQQRQTRWQLWDLNEPALLDRVRAVDPSFPEPSNSNDEALEIAQTRALFGQLGYQLTDRLSATVGARYTRDTVAASETARELRADTAASGSQTDRAAFEALTARIGLDYAWTDQIRGFIAWSNGTDRGGFNFARDPSRLELGLVPYDRETVNSVEAGVSARFLDDRLRLDGSFFIGHWADIQIAQELDPALSAVVNAEHAEISGFELATVLRATETLTVNLSVGRLDARYVPIGTTDTSVSSATLPFAPRWSYSVGLRYGRTLWTGGSLQTRVDYGWTDDQLTTSELERPYVQPAYGLLGASISYTPRHADWTVSLVGSNLTDEFYHTSSLRIPEKSYGIVGGTAGRPRTIGLRFDYQLR